MIVNFSHTCGLQQEARHKKAEVEMATTKLTAAVMAITTSPML